MDGNINNLITEYKKQSQIHSKIDYDDKSSVIRGNKAVDKMISIAKEINEHPSGIFEFRNLLNAKDDHLSLWASHHILEYMDYSSQDESTALKHIEKAAKNEYGEEIWLEEWKGKKK
jgi:hypothetical protein